MNWRDAFFYCEKYGMKLADWSRIKTEWDGVVTRIISENPICIDSKSSMYEYAKKSGICNEFANLTTTDTYVWFYPLVDTRGSGQGLVVNLKNGRVYLRIPNEINSMMWQKEYYPARALCEE